MANQTFLNKRGMGILRCSLFLLFLMAGFTVNETLAGNGKVDKTTGDASITVWLDSPPLPSQTKDIKQSLQQFSEIICDATEGQFKIKTVNLTGSLSERDRATFQFHAYQRQGSAGGVSGLRGFGKLGSHASLSGNTIYKPDVIAHEFGHHAFGLGEQYDAQGKWRVNSPKEPGCGFGPGFEANKIDEQNHSIMQQGWRKQCFGGTYSGKLCQYDVDCGSGSCQYTGQLLCTSGSRVGQTCLWDSQCGNGKCQPVHSSEFSVPQNHDRLRGTGQCGVPRATSKINILGAVSKSATARTFDKTSIQSAKSTSNAHITVNVFDSMGKVSEIHFFLYKSRYLPRSNRTIWLMQALYDEGVSVGGTTGKISRSQEWQLSLNSDGHFIINPFVHPDPRIKIANLKSGARNLNIEIRADLGSAAQNTYAFFEDDGYPECNKPECAKAWNGQTNMYESTDQSLSNVSASNKPLSDWETMVKEFPFLKMPAGLPVASSPSSCNYQVNFNGNVDAGDAVIIVMDRSGSMSSSIFYPHNKEVCGNGKDDDQDGTIDENDCVESRLTYAQGAARAFLSIFSRLSDSKTQVGFVSYNQQATLDLSPGMVSTSSGVTQHYYDLFKAVNAMRADGYTAIGEALAKAGKAIASLRNKPSSPVILLMTDGFNNSGRDPEKIATDLRKKGIRIHTFPAGFNTNIALMRKFAKSSGGYFMGSTDFGQLPGQYAEIAARQLGNSLLQPQTSFSVSQNPSLLREEIDRDKPILPEFIQKLNVEEGANDLVLFLGTRNKQLKTWKIGVDLIGPGGEHYTETSPVVLNDPCFLLLTVPNPTPGEWTLQVHPVDDALQEGTLVAFTNNPKPILFGDVTPSTVPKGETTLIRVHPGYDFDLDETDVQINGELIEPDGHTVSFTVQSTRNVPWNPPNWAKNLGPFTKQGIYRVNLRAKVGPAAAPSRSEPIFTDNDQQRLSMSISPFQRSISMSFIVPDGDPVCFYGDDCDGDGISDDVERDVCKNEDVDGDGLPNFLDVDSNNDEVNDTQDQLDDRNENGIPDLCETKQTVDVLQEQRLRREMKLR